MATHGYRFALLARIWAKALHRRECELLLGEAANVLHEAFFVHAHQAHCLALFARAAGAANAVHIVFAHIGDLVVHHVRQVFNVDAARSNVGGDQSADVAALEARQRLGACGLALVAMQGHGLDAVFGEVLGHVVGTELGAGEHQHLAPVVLLNDVREQCLLFGAPHQVRGLRDSLHRGVAGRDLHRSGVVQQALGEFANFVAEGGRKKQGLLLLGQERQHFFNVVDEAHVQHAVGFVEHQGLHGGQVQLALTLQIQQAAGSGHQNIHALAQRADLRVHADAAKHHGGAQLQVFAVGLCGLFNLRRQLAGGRHDEHADAGAAKAVFGAGSHGQAVQDGQHEGSGFAGAGLCAGQQVAACQHHRNGLGLDGSGAVVALFVHGTQDGGGEFQVVKVHIKIYSKK